MEVIFGIPYDNCVSRIIPTLILSPSGLLMGCRIGYLTSCNDVDVLAEKVDELALALIAPLRSNWRAISKFKIRRERGITDDGDAAGGQCVAVVHVLQQNW